jgi:NADPH2:quinone reductase
MKTHAFKIYKTGAPSVMKWEEVTLGKPGRGEVLLRQTAVGFNMVETYFRSGLYPLPGLPSGIGIEAAGVIEAVGPGVKGLKAGMRVCYAGGRPMGAYAEVLIKLPSHVDERTAAAAISKGTTVQFLFNEAHKLKKGETIIFHAAAGGVGLSPANGLAPWAPPSSAPSRRKKKLAWRNAMAASTRSWSRSPRI